MPITGTYGDVGTGKDLISVIDANFTPHEIPIYANFKINLKRAEKIEPEEIYEVFTEDSKIPIKKMITTELYGWLEARESAFSEMGKYISYMIFQSRKRGLNWMANAQLRSTVDLRWRGMEDKIIYCHPRDLDMSGNSSDDFHYTIMKNLKVANLTLEYETAKQFFGLYNTKDIIMPQEFEHLQNKIKFKKNPEMLNKFINAKASLIMKKFPIPSNQLKDGTFKYHISDDWVRDKLLELGETDAMEYTKYIKVRIKGKLGFD